MIWVESYTANADHATFASSLLVSSISFTVAFLDSIPFNYRLTFRIHFSVSSFNFTHLLLEARGSEQASDHSGIPDGPETQFQLTRISPGPGCNNFFVKGQLDSRAAQ
jgi:hypothetical protein